MNVMHDTSRLPTALDDWSAAIGEPYVQRDSAALRAANSATFATPAQALAILRPGTRSEVQDCLKIANRCGVPVYAVSTGKNWGYGSKAPVGNGVLIDLGRLNRILDFDEELAYVTIEPGVTQRQVHEYLRSRNSRLWMDATGASPDCSIIGNTLERGFGHTPYGDHAGQACGFEVVLPTGECIDTGFSRFSGATVGALNRYGVGPSLDGLFAQSGFGIVTRMTVWLMPAPEAFSAFFLMCRDKDGLGDIIDALRPLRLNGILRGIPHIGNDYKVLAASGGYPWEALEGATPLMPETIAVDRKRLGIGVWNGSGALYGTRAQVKDARRQVRKALAGKVTRLQFVDDRTLRWLSRFSTPFRWVTGWDFQRTLRVLEPVYGLLRGIPTDATISSAYWRKSGPPPAQPDPDRDRCGLLWCSPVVPSKGRDINEVVSLASKIVLEHKFEPQISVSLATERSLICVITISYDRDTAGEDERALRCYGDLVDELVKRGYPPYRLNVRSMHYLESADSPYGRLLSRLKMAFDPNGVFAPGRYEPSNYRERPSSTSVAS
jgi:4-cresol dehydrogenase (hydroxylating)